MGFFWDEKGPGLVSVHREDYGVGTDVCAFPSLLLTILQDIEIPQKIKNSSTLNLKRSFVEAEPFPLSLRKKMREK